MNNKSNILWGLFLICLGIGFAGNVFHIWHFRIFFRGFWTLLLIIPCAISISQKGPKTTSVLGLTIGILLLLSRQGILKRDIVGELIFPLILVVIGIGIIKNNISTKQISQDDYKKSQDCNKSFDYNFNDSNTNQNVNAHNQNSNANSNYNYNNTTTTKKEDNSLPSYSAMFAFHSDNCNNQVFHGANVNATVGSVCLYLEDAIIKEDVTIYCNVSFGSITLLLPSYVNIRISSTPIFGGVKNYHRESMAFDAPIVTIYAKTLFGTIEIR